jgi:hypothetical protein
MANGEYINHFDVQNLEDLLNAADSLRDGSDDHPSDTVYLLTLRGDGVRFTLEEKTLTDGSKVKNIVVSLLN